MASLLDFSKLQCNMGEYQVYSLEEGVVTKEGVAKGRKYLNVRFVRTGGLLMANIKTSKRLTFFAPDDVDYDVWHADWEKCLGETAPAATYTLVVPDHKKRLRSDLNGQKAGEFIIGKKADGTKVWRKYNTISVFSLCDAMGSANEDIPTMISTIWNRDCEEIIAKDSNSPKPATPAPTIPKSNAALDAIDDIVIDE